MNFKLEICIDSIESAINAQAAGADRVELCDNLPEGGTTPSLGLIATARDNLTIGLNVMIRPRGGDFLYSDAEFDIMIRDVDICGETGADGIVIGILNRDGSVDIERTQRLVELAHPMKVTFHRAFDLCSEPIRALEDIISTGASRVLTSGHMNSAYAGSALIKRLIEVAGDRMIIMPGGGLDETNIIEVAKITGANEFHMTGRKIIESEMQFRRNDVHMGSISDIPEYSRKVADPEKIKKIITALKMI
jgi:copper homeostasis protein